MPYISFKGKNLFYESLDLSLKNNTRNAVIYIHGSGEHSFVWKNQLKIKSDNYDMIALDLPSHGKSDYFKDLSLDLYVESVKALVNSLNINKVVLCGHSLGGAVILSYYFKYAGDIAGLILCSTGAKLRVLPIILKNTLNHFDTFLQNVPIGSFYRKSDEKLKENYVKEIAKIKPKVVHMDFKICDSFDVMEKIEDIKIPCLIIVGTADKLTPVKYSQYFKDKIANSKLIMIENAGHSVMIEKPLEMNDTVKDFIENL